MENNNTLGIEGRVRIIKHDVRGLSGSGPNGEMEFEDLWEVTNEGKLRSRYPERLVDDYMIKNKFTRRGLNYLMYTNLRGISGTEQSKQTAELAYPISGI